MNVEAFTGLSGTEESLKALGGKDLDVLHIATHGFYFTEDKVHWMKDNAFLQLSNIDNDIKDEYVEGSYESTMKKWEDSQEKTLNERILSAQKIQKADQRIAEAIEGQAEKTEKETLDLDNYIYRQGKYNFKTSKQKDI